ncbi:MAG TPA: YceI family protein [Gemmatimonadaceae bacterium]
MRVRLLALLALCGVVTPALRSQSTPVPVEPESRIWFDGTATLHGFTCTAGEFAAEVQPAAAHQDSTSRRPVQRRGTLTIPVRRLECGDGKMEKSMRKALRADENPDIRFELVEYDLARQSDDSATVRADGTLELAGETRSVSLVVGAKRRADGAVRLTGSRALYMTDFGITPPTGLLGLIKAGNRIVVRFDVVVPAERLATASR